MTCGRSQQKKEQWLPYAQYQACLLVLPTWLDIFDPSPLEPLAHRRNHSLSFGGRLIEPHFNSIVGVLDEHTVLLVWFSFATARKFSKPSQVRILSIRSHRNDFNGRAQSYLLKEGSTNSSNQKQSNNNGFIIIINDKNRSSIFGFLPNTTSIEKSK